MTGRTHLDQIPGKVFGKVEMLGRVAALVELDIREETHAVLHGGIDGDARACEIAVYECRMYLQPEKLIIYTQT